MCIQTKRMMMKLTPHLFPFEPRMITTNHWEISLIINFDRRFQTKIIYLQIAHKKFLILITWTTAKIIEHRMIVIISPPSRLSLLKESSFTLKKEEEDDKYIFLAWFQNIVLKPGPTGWSGTRLIWGWNWTRLKKNKGKKNPVWPGWPDGLSRRPGKTRLQTCWLFFLFY